MIYLDNNATTAIDPRVLEAMRSVLEGPPHNPSSVHSFGRLAKSLLTHARTTIATYLNVKKEEILFTSGGTEAINLILQGMPEGHIITSNVEHSAVVKCLERRGGAITYLPAGLFGAVTADALQAAIRPDTCLIALIAVNNETGVKIDIDAIATVAEEAQIPLFIDGIAWLGKEEIRIPKGVSAIAFSGHKFHAPQGVGFAFIRSRLKVAPLILGGPQESERRGGTENLAGIVALARAIELIPSKTNMAALRDQFEAGLKANIPALLVNGEGPRICNVSNLVFPAVDGETLLIALDQTGILASHGSACASGSLEPSRVLLNMGLPRHLVTSSIRFSLSRQTTAEEIEESIKRITATVRGLKR